MFGTVSDAFQKLFRRLSGNATISVENVREAMADVRTALLEADVNLRVVEEFCDEVVKDAVGRDVTRSLRPGEEMIGIVYRRLVAVLGGDPDSPSADVDPASGRLVAGESPILSVSPGPAVVMMCGLQGSGKTTTCGKLAAYLKKRGRSVMLAAADLQRPAAVEQLQTVGEQVQKEHPGGASVSVYAEPERVAEYGRAVGVAVGVCQRALTAAQRSGVDTLILDTAGRLHVNDELMAELDQVNRVVQPHQVMLVVDAMTGQDAVASAKAFHERLAVDGVILTKFDSDARGGAAISIRRVTGAPIRFIGVGEKLDALEEFRPDRIASRILGMGDVLSLVEKAQAEISEADTEEITRRMAEGGLTMDDFLKQLRTLRRMGPMKNLLGLLPGVGSMLKDVHIEDKQLDRVEAMVGSMTRDERRRPEILNFSRRKRIAAGSGTTVNDVGQLARQFETLNKITRQMAGMSSADKMRAVRDLGGGGPAPGAMPPLRPRGSTFTAGMKDRFKKRRK